MIKAWAYRNPSPPGHSLVTAGSAPLLAVLAGGLGLGGLALLAFPELSPGSAGAAVVGLCTAGFLLAARSVLALVIEPRAVSDGILLLGREELANRLGRDLLKEGRTQVFGWKGASEAPAAANGNGNGQGNGGPPAMTLDPVQLKTLVRQESISRIVVLEPDLEAGEDLASALLECRLLGVRVEDAVELYQRLHGKIWLEALDPGRLAFADGFRITPYYRFVKRVVDVICASLLLVLAGPVIAAIALAIKLESPGPILFRQERVGQFGKVFTLLKFRSMREDAEKDGPAWASKNDSRVTRIGGFLRKSHLDELPQAINVLRGDLSFVGPRPERPCFVAMLREKIPFFDLRLYVKPGITGWAQVRYPYCDSVEDSYEKLQYDLYYARKASPLLDLEILARTGAVMLTGRGR